MQVQRQDQLFSLKKVNHFKGNIFVTLKIMDRLSIINKTRLETVTIWQSILVMT